MGLVLCIAAILAAAQACADARASVPALMDNVSWVCNREQPLLVAANPDGGWLFNAQPADSARLLHILQTVLSPRPEKVVMVQLDSARAGALSWIVPAIEGLGGDAYAADTACLPLPPGAPRPLFPR
jgi:hypothetical protein